ncbi:hypothetical protein [Clostridium sp. B9]|uniref:hypothetical protein n=1 Tax=Clostridium sp. B9 TaxID=3423224 RepID=UPI003D2EF0A6
MLRMREACIKEFYLNNRRGLIDTDGCIYLDGRYAGVMAPNGIVYIEGKRGFIGKRGEMYLDGEKIGFLNNYSVAY